MSKHAASFSASMDSEISDNSVNLNSSDYNSLEDDLRENNRDSDVEVEHFSSVRIWYESDTDNIPPAPQHFPFTATPGVNVIMDENATAPSYFEILFNEPLMNILVNETNKYANQKIEKQAAQSGNKKTKKWVNVDIAEMKVFLGILLIQSILHLPEQEWYWSKRESMF